MDSNNISLPNEVLQHTLSFLEARDLPPWAAVNHKFRDFLISKRSREYLSPALPTLRRFGEQRQWVIYRLTDAAVRGWESGDRVIRPIIRGVQPVLEDLSCLIADGVVFTLIHQYVEGESAVPVITAIALRSVSHIFGPIGPVIICGFAFWKLREVSLVSYQQNAPLQQLVLATSVSTERMLMGNTGPRGWSVPAVGLVAVSYLCRGLFNRMNILPISTVAAFYSGTFISIATDVATNLGADPATESHSYLVLACRRVTMTALGVLSWCVLTPLAVCNVARVGVKILISSALGACRR